MRFSLQSFVLGLQTWKERTDTISLLLQRILPSKEIGSDVFGWSWMDPNACEAQIRSWRMYEGFNASWGLRPFVYTGLNTFVRTHSVHCTHSLTRFTGLLDDIVARLVGQFIIDVLAPFKYWEEIGNI